MCSDYATEIKSNEITKVRYEVKLIAIRVLRQVIKKTKKQRNKRIYTNKLNRKPKMGYNREKINLINIIHNLSNEK